MVQILFLLFLSIAKYDSEFETKENITRTKDKIELQRIQGLRLQHSQRCNQNIFLTKLESKICEHHIYVQLRTVVVWVTILSLTHMTIHISNANRTAHLKLPQDYP